MIANIQILKKRYADLLYALSYVEQKIQKLQKRNENVERVVASFRGNSHSFALNIFPLPFQAKLGEKEYLYFAETKNAIANRIYLDYYEIYRNVKKFVVDVVKDDATISAVNGIGLVRNIRGKERDSDIIRQLESVHNAVVLLLGSIQTHIDVKDTEVFICEQMPLFGLNNGVCLANMNYEVSLIREKYGLFVNSAVAVLETYISMLSKLGEKACLSNGGDEVADPPCSFYGGISAPPPSVDSAASVADASAAASVAAVSPEKSIKKKWKNALMGVFGFRPKSSRQNAKSLSVVGGKSVRGDGLELVEKDVSEMELDASKIYGCAEMFSMENSADCMCSAKSLVSSAGEDSDMNLYELETLDLDASQCEFVDKIEFAFTCDSDQDNDRQ